MRDYLAEALAGSARLPEPPPPHAAAPIDPMVDGDGDLPPAMEPPPPLQPPLIEGASDSEGNVDGDAGVYDGLPDALLGARIMHERKVTRNGELIPSLRVVCPHHGFPCRKQRAMHLLATRFGHKAPLLFLGAWIDGGPARSAENHTAWNPGPADMRAFLASGRCP